MTRWTIYLIINDKVLKTVEFNGDMYPDWHGDTVMKELTLVKDEHGFRDFVKKFNADNFWYEDELVYEITRTEFDEYYTDMRENYFENHCSGYIFFKNISDEEIQFITSDGITISLCEQDQLRFNFGNLIEKDTYDYVDDAEGYDEELINEQIATSISEGYTSGELHNGKRWELTIS